MKDRTRTTELSYLLVFSSEKEPNAYFHILHSLVILKAPADNNQAECL